MKSALEQLCPDAGELKTFTVADDFAGLASEIQRMPIDGMICCNDQTAAAMIVELDHRGVELPRQLRIAGIDDVKYAKLIKPGLTTYRQPCRDIATVAVELMLQRLKQRQLAPRKVLVKGQLVVRESSQGSSPYA